MHEVWLKQKSYGFRGQVIWFLIYVFILQVMVCFVFKIRTVISATPANWRYCLGDSEHFMFIPFLVKQCVWKLGEE